MSYLGERKKRMKREVLTQFTSKGGEGCSEAQIALWRFRIAEITNHLKTHKKDFSSQRGLKIIIGKMNRMLRYLKKNQPSVYVRVSAK